MKQDGKIRTKYPLRKAYEECLPVDCITRPQTMAFTGSGIYETIFKIYQKHFDFKKEVNGKLMCSLWKFNEWKYC